VFDDGIVDKTGWVASNDGLLVWDKNSDGVINDGSELFGEGSIMPDGTRAVTGYEALTVFDINFDKQVDKTDQKFNQLKIWKDQNSNAITEFGELESLNDHGIESLSLDYYSSNLVDNGNLVGLMGSYTTDTGEVRTMGDVWFSTDNDGNYTFDLSGLVDNIEKNTNIIDGLKNQGRFDLDELNYNDILQELEAEIEIYSDEDMNFENESSSEADPYMVFVKDPSQTQIPYKGLLLKRTHFQNSYLHHYKFQFQLPIPAKYHCNLIHLNQIFLDS
jgi:hypothetical protein